MKHDRHRTALERSVAEQNRLIADIAASVNAPVPSRDERCLYCGGAGYRDIDDCMVPCSYCDSTGRAPDSYDDEDAILDEGEPREIPLTEAQKRAAYWDEKTDADEAWREEEDE